jgi:hypothetical protein
MGVKSEKGVNKKLKKAKHLRKQKLTHFFELGESERNHCRNETEPYPNAQTTP